MNKVYCCCCYCSFKKKKEKKKDQLAPPGKTVESVNPLTCQLIKEVGLVIPASHPVDAEIWAQRFTAKLQMKPSQFRSTRVSIQSITTSVLLVWLCQQPNQCMFAHKALMPVICTTAHVNITPVTPLLYLAMRMVGGGG